MKKQSSWCSLLFAVALVFLAMPMQAAPPVHDSADLAAIFGPTSCSVGHPMDREDVRPYGPGGRPGAQTKAIPCDARCVDGTYVGCWGTSCMGVNANCPYEKGYCYGNYSGLKVCPTCNQCKADGKCV